MWEPDLRNQQQVFQDTCSGKGSTSFHCPQPAELWLCLSQLLSAPAEEGSYCTMPGPETRLQVEYWEATLFLVFLILKRLTFLWPLIPRFLTGAKKEDLRKCLTGWREQPLCSNLDVKMFAFSRAQWGLLPLGGGTNDILHLPSVYKDNVLSLTWRELLGLTC